MAQPVVRLPEVIEDDPGAVVRASAQHNGRGAVGLTGHPAAVHCVRHQHHRHHGYEALGHLRVMIRIRHF